MAYLHDFGVRRLSPLFSLFSPIVVVLASAFQRCLRPLVGHLFPVHLSCACGASFGDLCFARDITRDIRNSNQGILTSIVEPFLNSVLLPLCGGDLAR